MRARAEIRVELRDGISALVTLAGQPPLLARPGGRSAAGMLVHLVTGAGGPCAGDDLELAVTVGPRATLEVRSVGATVALPGRPGAPASRLHTKIVLAEGATLRWLPEPVVGAAGCDHVLATTVSMAASARLLLREELVCGRSGENPGGDLLAHLRIERAGRPVLDQEIALGADRLLARTLGTLVSVEPADRTWDPASSALFDGDDGAAAVATALAEPGACAVSALAPDTVRLRRLLDTAASHASRQLAPAGPGPGPR